MVRSIVDGNEEEDMHQGNLAAETRGVDNEGVETDSLDIKSTASSSSVDPRDCK